MSPPRITKAFVTRNVDAFTTKVGRARELYKKIVLHGYSGTSAATAAKLINPDTRDAAEFIFFEIAAKFEDFVKVMFQAEVRLSLAIALAQSPFLMGDSDNGLDSRLERGSPQKLKGRGIDLLGMDSFFGSLDTKLGADTCNQLIAAHIVRGRIAHGGGHAQAKFLKLLGEAGIAAEQRKGMSVGRFLRDYPLGTTTANRNFFAYLDAYTLFAASAKAGLPSKRALKLFSRRGLATPICRLWYF